MSQKTSSNQYKTTEQKPDRSREQNYSWPTNVQHNHNKNPFTKGTVTAMFYINTINDVLTNGSVGTVTTRGASLMYSSMVVRKDCGG